ncbi:MAG TPA: hypothetical protein VFY25_03815 [Anaerolineales bacterium]|nr:hypothetical protein [Anaerolineales bacterium]
MKPVYVLIIGLPLAAAIAAATALPIVVTMGAMLLWALWLEAGNQQRA